MLSGNRSILFFGLSDADLLSLTTENIFNNICLIKVC
jgi:hypothetical protein